MAGAAAEGFVLVNSSVITVVDGLESLPLDDNSAGHPALMDAEDGELPVADLLLSGSSSEWQSVQSAPLVAGHLCPICQRVIGSQLPGAPAPIHLSEQFVIRDTFFTKLLVPSAAVPDPEGTSSTSAGIQLSSSPAESPWENWGYDWGGQSPITEACQGRVLGLPLDYLGHVRLIDLYCQLASEWSVLQDLRPAVGPAPSFSTFIPCSQCQGRADLQSIRHRSNVTWSSRQAVQPEVICIIIDSMGECSSAWPKFNHDKIPHDLEKISRPTMILTAALAHEWGAGLYFSLEPLGHGSVRALAV